MRRVIGGLAALAVLGAAGGATAAQVIAGPELVADEIGWTYEGIEFEALQDSTLLGFTFQNQGGADTVVLTDAAGSILHSLVTPAGSPSFTASVNWALSAGSTYRLLSTANTNGRFVLASGPLPSNSDIAITAGFFGSSTATPAYQQFWASFNDIVTSGDAVGAVPEPATWAVMILGFGAVGATLRRRSVAAA